MWFTCSKWLFLIVGDIPVLVEGGVLAVSGILGVNGLLGVNGK